LARRAAFVARRTAHIASLTGLCGSVFVQPAPRNITFIVIADANEGNQLIYLSISADHAPSLRKGEKGFSLASGCSATSQLQT
jgi:hypothetical protein